MTEQKKNRSPENHAVETKEKSEAVLFAESDRRRLNRSSQDASPKFRRIRARPLFCVGAGELE